MAGSCVTKEGYLSVEASIFRPGLGYRSGINGLAVRLLRLSLGQVNISFWPLILPVAKLQYIRPVYGSFLCLRAREPFPIAAGCVDPHLRDRSRRLGNEAVRFTRPSVSVSDHARRWILDASGDLWTLALLRDFA